uniref:Uncharacterized protein n=1 Tax=Arundo donax TaxID=35708 RepID=A0A0A9DWX0_ARUDO
MVADLQSLREKIFALHNELRKGGSRTISALHNFQTGQNNILCLHCFVIGDHASTVLATMGESVHHTR